MTVDELIENDFEDVGDIEVDGRHYRQRVLLLCDERGCWADVNILVDETEGAWWKMIVYYRMTIGKTTGSLEVNYPNVRGASWPFLRERLRNAWLSFGGEYRYYL